jgi:hypothetical protein
MEVFDVPTLRALAKRLRTPYAQITQISTLRYLRKYLQWSLWVLELRFGVADFTQAVEISQGDLHALFDAAVNAHSLGGMPAVNAMLQQRGVKPRQIVCALDQRKDRSTRSIPENAVNLWKALWEAIKAQGGGDSALLEIVVRHTIAGFNLPTKAHGYPLIVRHQRLFRPAAGVWEVTLFWGNEPIPLAKHGVDPSKLCAPNAFAINTGKLTQIASILRDLL